MSNIESVILEAVTTDRPQMVLSAGDALDVFDTCLSRVLQQQLRLDAEGVVRSWLRTQLLIPVRMSKSRSPIEALYQQIVRKAGPEAFADFYPDLLLKQGRRASQDSVVQALVLLPFASFAPPFGSFPSFPGAAGNGSVRMDKPRGLMLFPASEKLRQAHKASIAWRVSSVRVRQGNSFFVFPGSPIYVLATTSSLRKVIPSEENPLPLDAREMGNPSKQVDRFPVDVESPFELAPPFILV